MKALVVMTMSSCWRDRYKTPQQKYICFAPYVSGITSEVFLGSWDPEFWGVTQIWFSHLENWHTLTRWFLSPIFGPQKNIKIQVNMAVICNEFFSTSCYKDSGGLTKWKLPSLKSLWAQHCEGLAEKLRISVVIQVYLKVFLKLCL